VLQRVAVCCSVLHLYGSHGLSMLQCVAVCNAGRRTVFNAPWQHGATHCNTLQHAVTNHNTPQHTLTPVAGPFLPRLGLEKIFKTQGIFKTKKSALLVRWKGVINPALQCLVNQYFSQREKY